MTTASRDAPWPLVGECYGHRAAPTAGRPESCPQCDGSHQHRWKAWHQAPQVAPGISCVEQMSGPGLPVRCSECGGRKCDEPRCTERRHHTGPHLGLDDSVRQVGT